MDNEDPKLRAKLEQLDEELKQVVSVDEEGRKILHRLRQDLEELLLRSGEATDRRHVSIAGRLRQAIEHFEVTHPALAASMEEVVNTLSAMGF